MPRAAQQKPASTTPAWRYDPHRAVLHVQGDSFIGDLKFVKRLIEAGELPFMLDAIVHRVNGVDVPMLLVGHFLSKWLIAGVLPDYLWHFSTQAMRKSA